MQCLIRALPSVKSQNRWSTTMRKVNGEDSSAQWCSSCENYGIAIVELASNSCDLAMLLPWFYETVLHQGLWSIDPRRMHKIDEDFLEKWWKMCDEVWRILREMEGKTVRSLKNVMSLPISVMINIIYHILNPLLNPN